MSELAVFRKRIIVTEREIDGIGHVNNVAWLKLAMSLAADHSSAVGLPFHAYVERGGFLIVRRHEIDYLLPALPGEELVGETWVSDMHAARSTRHVRFVRERDGAVVFAMKSLWAWVDARSGRPRRIPSDVLARFEIVKEAPPVPGAG